MIPTTAPSSAPIAPEPAAQPSRTPIPMQATSTVRRTPPAPAALNCDEVVPCIRGENSSVRGSTTRYFVTPESRMDSQPRLLLVHGSVVNAELTWGAQKPLAERFEIVAPNRR